MVSLVSSSSRSGAPALVASSAGAAKRLGGLPVRSRPPLPALPGDGRPEPRGPGTRALGGSARLQRGSGRLLSPVPPRAGRPRPCLPAPRTRPASPGKAGAQSGGPGIRVLCHRAHVARSPRRRASERRWRGAQRGSRRGGGPERGAAHSPAATRRRGHSPIRPAAQSRGGG